MRNLFLFFSLLLIGCTKETAEMEIIPLNQEPVMLNDTSAKSSNEVIIDNYKVILPPGIKFVRMFSQQSNETVTGWEFSKEGSSAYYFVYKAGPSVYESFVSPKGNKGIILGYFRNVQDALNAFNGG